MGLYRKHFGVVAAVVIVHLAALDLLSSYMDYFVFVHDDFRKSFKFYQFLDNFVGYYRYCWRHFDRLHVVSRTRPSFRAL